MERLALDFGPASKHDRRPTGTKFSRSSTAVQPYSRTSRSTTSSTSTGTGTSISTRSKFSKPNYSDTKFSTSNTNTSNTSTVDKDVGYDDVTDTTAGTHKSGHVHTDPTRKEVQLHPFRSQGDPKQFLVEGSIGDRRVRALVDTGATISFISRDLVPLLKSTSKIRLESCMSSTRTVLNNSTGLQVRKSNKFTAVFVSRAGSRLA